MSVVLAALVFTTASAAVGVHTYLEMNVPGDPHAARFALQDFRDAAYYPVTAALDGNNPYDVEKYQSLYPVHNRFPAYAPSHLLLYLPFAFFPHGTAQSLYLALNLLLSALLCFVTLRIAGIRATPVRTLLGASAVILSHPGELNLYVGQSGLIMTLATYGAVWLAASRPALAGGLVAVVATKPTFGIPVLALLALRGNTKAVMYGAGFTAASCIAVFVWIAVFSGGLVATTSAIVENITGWGQTGMIQHETAAHRADIFVAVAHALGRPAPRVLTFVAVLGLLITGGVVLRTRTTADSPSDRRTAVAVVSCIALSGFYHQVYDALLLCLPVAIAVVAVPRLGHERHDRFAAAVVVGAGAVIAANYISSYSVLDYLEPFPHLRSILASTNALAAVAIGIVVLRQAWIATPRERTRDPEV